MYMLSVAVSLHKAELSSCNRDLWPTKLKILLGSLQKKFVDNCVKCLALALEPSGCSVPRR